MWTSGSRFFTAPLECAAFIRNRDGLKYLRFCILCRGLCKGLLGNRTGSRYYFSMKMPAEFAVPREFDGARLDAALALVLPESGVRARRRLWEAGAVLVNGTARKPGWLVRAGDMIRIQSAVAEGSEHLGEESGQNRIRLENTEQTPPFSILGIGNGFAAFDKPAGLHTAHIAGSATSSLEALLPGFWEQLWKGWHRLPGKNGTSLSRALPPPPRLVTRLDGETSGIVLGIIPGLMPVEPDPGAGKNASSKPGDSAMPIPLPDNAASGTGDCEAALALFRKWERQGKVRKEYFALVSGEVAGVLDLRQQLDTANRRVTKVLAGEERDRTRHTHVEPLAVLSPETLLEKGIVFAAPPACLFTLVRVTILRGARHQIRAHLAHAGFPILGDGVYGATSARGGNSPSPEASRMYLHHARLSLPGFSVQSLPGWNAGEYLQG